MGKDRKESSKSKETLMEEDVELTKQLNDLKSRFKDLYTHVETLARTYDACKEHFALRRYGELKRMIKACISDEVMQKATQPPQKETGKSKSLLNAARQWSRSAQASRKIWDEVSGLHKAELVVDIKQKKRAKGEVEKKFLQLHNHLVNLSRAYEESKRRIPTTRYRVMKEMIQPLTNFALNL